MKVKQIVQSCGEILHLNFADEYFESRDTPDDANAKILVNACNLVLEELCRDYATSLRRTVVEANNGFVDTSAYKLCKVISLVDEEGNDVKFRYSDDGLRVEMDGKYNLTYTRLPDCVSWEDELPLPSRIGERIMIYGVLREYYTLIGDWQIAKQWDMRFKDALSATASKTSNMRMPVGRWV